MYRLFRDATKYKNGTHLKVRYSKRKIISLILHLLKANSQIHRHLRVLQSCNMVINLRSCYFCCRIVKISSIHSSGSTYRDATYSVHAVYFILVLQNIVFCYCYF